MEDVRGLFDIFVTRKQDKTAARITIFAARWQSQNPI
jgi:hypothetical protein